MNLLIVEVKPANADKNRMVDDLKKLTYFRNGLKDKYGNPGNYYAAYFWIYGISLAEWPDLRDDLLGRLNGSNKFDQNLVSCIIHTKPGVRATPVTWADAAH